MSGRILTVSYIVPNNQKEMASIKLQGRWLEKLGFSIGTKIIVTEEYGQLLIKLNELED